MKSITVILSTFVLLAMATVGFAGHHASILKNKQGMTLYTFDKDQNGKSNCYDGCAVKWPPYLVSKGAEAKKGWSVVKRRDDTQQWAYKGQPLYTWVGDTKPGETNGDGVGGVWHVAKKGEHKAKSQSGYSGSKY